MADEHLTDKWGVILPLFLLLFLPYYFCYSNLWIISAVFPAVRRSGFFCCFLKYVCFWRSKGMDCGSLWRREHWSLNILLIFSLFNKYARRAQLTVIVATFIFLFQTKPVPSHQLGLPFPSFHSTLQSYSHLILITFIKILYITRLLFPLQYPNMSHELSNKLLRNISWPFWAISTTKELSTICSIGRGVNVIFSQDELASIFLSKSVYWAKHIIVYSCQPVDKKNPQKAVGIDSDGS